ncbi:MAG: bifunctional folylpolyglutamate synthase/dihydrofolate synthase [Acidimicrobiales bacterium]
MPEEPELRRAIAYLDRHLNREVAPSLVDDDALASMRALMRALGDPQLDTPVIQVTGTNGKGSTSAMITALLAGMGLSVGTYSSPHVSTVRERISRNGEAIGASDLAELIEDLARVEPTIDVTPSWFELMTAAAYRWFADIAVDVAVVEVGLLGRFDATSVADAAVAVITNVDYDHTDGGPTWRRDLAWEEAGIIRPGATVVLGETDPDLEDVFLAERPGSLLRRDVDFACEDNELAVGGRLVTLWTPDSRHGDLFVSMHGAHQGDNAAVALAAAEAYLGTAVPFEVAEEAFAQVFLPGRFEVLSREPLVIVDGAHNPAGAEASLVTLEEGFSVAGRRLQIVGLLGERDLEWMLTALGADRADMVIACTAPSPRAIPARVIAAAAAALDVDVEVVEDPGDAAEWALSMATEEDLVLASGSLYVAGAVRDRLLAG